jgi:hypothetical protein
MSLSRATSWFGTVFPFGDGVKTAPTPPSPLSVMRKGGDREKRFAPAVGPLATDREAVSALCPSFGMTEKFCSLTCRSMLHL